MRGSELKIMADSTKQLLIELKSEGGNAGAFTGVLSTYDNVDSVGDICARGCYAKDLAINGTKRPLLWQHDPHQPIGSFEVVDSEKALTIAGKLNLDVPQGQTAYALLKAGDIDGLSIGYSAMEATWDAEGHRVLTEVKLWEGSVVTFPANDQATITNVKEGRKEGDTMDEELEKRLKALEDRLDALEKSKKEDETQDDETEDENQEDEGKKSVLDSIVALTAHIKTL